MRIFLLLLALSLAPASCRMPRPAREPVLPLADSAGIRFYENDRLVLHYRGALNPAGDSLPFADFIHPLNDLQGNELTEVAPADHPHHRGVFWAWHQLRLDSLTLGDGWMMEGVDFSGDSLWVSSGSFGAAGRARVFWSSDTLRQLRGEAGSRFLEENLRMWVHPSEPHRQVIDLEIRLRALLPGVRLGGSADEKGYGGLSLRLREPEKLGFRSTNGPVVPDNLQVVAGPWMDFTHLTLHCHPSTPNYPAPWILRQTASMQNIVFPGREPVLLETDRDLVLRYRLILHDASWQPEDGQRWQEEYEAWPGTFPGLH
ncbi:MAG: DUF6807 family protein [Bacteroidales bacterium]